jgi:hypothetical protein
MKLSLKIFSAWLFLLTVLSLPLNALANTPQTANSQLFFPTGARANSYGIAAHPWWLKLQLDNFIKYYKDLHVNVVRLPVEWKTLEPNPASYDWSLNDRLLNRLNDEGFQVIAEFVTIPVWASSNPAECAKDDVQCGFGNDSTVKAHLQTLATMLVKRYPFIRMWEFWNEPDFWPHAGKNIDDYAPYLQTFYQG